MYNIFATNCFQYNCCHLQPNISGTTMCCLHSHSLTHSLTKSSNQAIKQSSRQSIKQLFKPSVNKIIIKLKLWKQFLYNNILTIIIASYVTKRHIWSQIVDAIHRHISYPSFRGPFQYKDAVLPVWANQC